MFDLASDRRGPLTTAVLDGALAGVDGSNHCELLFRRRPVGTTVLNGTRVFSGGPSPNLDVELRRDKIHPDWNYTLI